ncbi:hypothetical protein CGJ36_22635 [Vibrio parahaemolyticus]|uniref:hypothetical protein n=1 Tax=Vibrio parahaemolyticus TaxID=670 RepID=UPI0011222082|nr:hypothetical protein [Vibrio parahaemolyticus]TOE71994.1 hypothetical protein CGJ36_22635 [Vibrio parahaemolyticus]
MVTLKQPSDLYDAIQAELESRLADEVIVASYADFGDVQVVDAMVLIEFEQTSPATRGHDGRYCHQYDITLHAVVGRQRQRAELEAINLAAAIERVTDENLWGLPYQQVDRPENIRSAPSMFKVGSDGYDAWGVSFRQRIYLGASLLDDDPVVREVWTVTTPPADADDESQYERVPDA